ncbi:TonB-dependent receptor [Myroides sp. 1354]|uniref:TonB-dependent receptor plug domain-containing protein n=1 Tax=unclassified Myroides TaxID=2642485 RepID=UPI0025752F2D|nr:MULTISPECIES: TonB-dependent receptor [unclassified Myroides]MDM1043943.1 TonB-dependent receptor [Myroides sp. R163-1]MDM1054878.1 TonB-dependent receptor [Myroides sp. 1354]MDM1068175.1 TonB-dependent receptor [Myroides sp. 1372]
MIKHFVTLAVLTAGTSLYAQQTITGQIVDETHTPIIGASVFYAKQSIGVATDAQGKFTLNFIEKEPLTVSYIGYQTQTISPQAGQSYHLVLQPEESLGEVIIQTKQRNTTRSIKGTTNSFTMNSGELLKAACCNISEAFETNPSIDVNYTDAITGTKQIKMLGLTSPYILIAEENIPSVRGASQIYGLTFTPGTWVESIQVTKGAGTVINGYESISGQLNTELIKPATDRPFYLNLYGSNDERFEANVHGNYRLSDKWSSSLFIHGNLRTGDHDKNHDGFLDMPKGEQINVMNRWQYINPEKGVVSFITARYMKDNKVAGQVDFDKKKDKGSTVLWGSEINTEKLDLSTKLGYVFADMPFQSAGLQVAYNYHKQDSYFGLNMYDIKQNSLYSNFVFNSIISNTLHKFTTGLSFTLDQYTEQVLVPGIDGDFNRTDNALGAFYEYTYDNTTDFSVVAGMRVDYHNRMGVFATPRLHLRYNPWENGVLRASVGRGKRLANVFAENQIFFATNRYFQIEGNNGKIYDLDPEIAWNYGLSFTQNFHLIGRKGDVTLDFYRTDFENQIVVDADYNAHQLLFYNLEGKSYANSFQLEVNYNLARNLNLRSAYKYYDIATDQKTGKFEKAYQPKHRFFANLEYTTNEKDNGAHWKFDFTYNWLGKQRMTSTAQYAEVNQLKSSSNPYSLMNFQITKVFSPRFEFYVGGENIGNYKQRNPIVSAQNPFDADFDTSMVYAPIAGSMYYAGLRFKLD